jgi:uncharacterized protein with von Willebrand factor type A (vWA) domain
VTDQAEFFLWTLFQQLVRRNFAIGPAEYGAAQQALRAGFGWSSRDELKEMLRALWASSREEAAVVSALFEQYAIVDWTQTDALPQKGDTPVDTDIGKAGNSGGTIGPLEPNQPNVPKEQEPEIVSTGSLPPLRSEEMPRLPFSHVFLPQYPANFRNVAQTWRRLRWPLREGAATELDIEATVAQRCRQGVASPPVLRPRRRNQARVLLLIDRKGSMAPFQGYIDEVRTAIALAGRLGAVGCYFFHDTPLEGADLALLGRLGGGIPNNLDPILHDIPGLTEGEFYCDQELFIPRPASHIFREWTTETAIVVMGDGGAARGRLDLVRLLDTIASLKGLLTVTSRLVWLNPVPASAWGGSTARQIARHIPMFPMDRDGMHRAVNVLRGQPFALERPLAGSSHRPKGTVV